MTPTEAAVVAAYARQQRMLRLLLCTMRQIANGTTAAAPVAQRAMSRAARKLGTVDRRLKEARL